MRLEGEAPDCGAFHNLRTRQLDRHRRLEAYGVYALMIVVRGAG